jgi:hypothetical protein
VEIDSNSTAVRIPTYSDAVVCTKFVEDIHARREGRGLTRSEKV